MNSPTHYRSLRTGALYRFVPHTNTGNFAWFERQDTGEQVRLRVATLEPVRAALAKAEGTDSGLAAHRREKAREAAADHAEERNAITSWRNRA